MGGLQRRAAPLVLRTGEGSGGPGRRHGGVALLAGAERVQERQPDSAQAVELDIDPQGAEEAVLDPQG